MARGIGCEAQDAIVTTGIRHRADLIARLLLRSGDVVAVEDLGCIWCRKIFENVGAKLHYIRLDDEGIRVQELARYTGVKVVHVIPAHHAPLGVSMSASRRLELLDWAARHGAFIIEDGYDSEFSYHGAPLPAIKAIDRVDRVVFCGSFNKTWFPNLRIGYMLAPAALQACLAGMLEMLGRAVGSVEQRSLAHYMESGEYARHLRVSRHAYQARRDLLLACLSKEYGRELRVT